MGGWRSVDSRFGSCDCAQLACVKRLCLADPRAPMVGTRDVKPLHHVYLSPGMFGFGKLASYDYFAHLERALAERFAARGERLVTHVVDVAPTASIRRRAVRLAELVATTSGDADGDDGARPGPIHLIGHSTGGLDARLVASPSVHLAISPARLAWRSRLASVTTMSTPHYGTPLASFFATVSGQRMLHAISALTFIGLSLGAPPLAAASALIMGMSRLDGMLGVELSLVDRLTDALLGALEPARSREVRSYLDAIQRDQGAVIQLTPEAMDLFQAGIEDRPGVVYQCTCAMAPAPSAGHFARSLSRPWHVLSSTLFATLHGITARYDERYPCAAPDAGRESEALLVRSFGRSPGARANDGVVPTRSQVWGRIAWAGMADHLDVLGHFGGGELQGAGLPDPATRHVDWLRSGSNFDRRAFGRMVDAIVEGMLDGMAGGMDGMRDGLADEPAT